jgi:hypothetical protein
MSVKTVSLAAAIGMLLGTTAHATDFGDIFSVRGYGTIGVAHSDENRADFVESVYSQPRGTAFTDSLSFDVDSKAAVQVDMKFNDRLSAVVQIISEGNENNTWDGDINTRYKPSLEWANISYKLTDEITLRGGRIVLPLLMSAEFRKVGYANPMIRPAVEVYGGTPYSSSDGGDISWRKAFGSNVNTVRAWYGGQADRTSIFQAQIHVAGVSEKFETGDLTVRGAYEHTTFKSAHGFLEALFPPFIAATSSLPGGIGANAAAAATDIYHSFDINFTQKIDFYDIGANYDPGNWFVSAEVIRQSSDKGGLINGSTAGDIFAGLRIKKFTPYVGIARTATEDRDSPTIPLAGLPAPLQAFGGIVNGTVKGIVKASTSQTSISAGVRWDFMKNFDLKAQFDHIMVGNNSKGLFANVQPGFPTDGANVNVISVAVDFVF